MLCIYIIYGFLLKKSDTYLMHAHMVHLEFDTQGVFGSESDTLIVS